MHILALILLISFFLSFLLVPLVKKIAPALKAVDEPDSSLKIHNRPIPRLGGVAIFFGFVSVNLLALFLGIPINGEVKRQLLAVLIGATMLLSLGIIDDIRGIQPYHRFPVQILAAVILILFGLKINISLFLPLGIILTIFYVVGACNSMNLLDGIDGLAAGVTIIACIAFCIVFGKQGESLGLILSIALLGSTLGFLWHNFNPASIFMGDSGSLFLGCVLAVLAILYLRTPNDILTFLVPIAILGVPIFDTTLTLIRRTINHNPLFPGDRGHSYDKLIRKGLNQKQTVFVVYGIGIIFAITGILFTTITLIPALILIACEIIGLAIMVLKFDMLSC